MSGLGGKAADLRGGPGHTALLGALIAVPAIELTWTIGDGEDSSEVLQAMGPANWPDVLVGMLLGDALFASLLAVVISRMIFAYYAAHGAVPHKSGLADTLRVVALLLANPLASGLVILTLFGPGWGLGTTVVAFVLRQGIVVEYRTGRRSRDGHRHDHQPPSSLRERLTALEQWVAFLLMAVALPVTALAVALDGESWAPVVVCNVDIGQGAVRDRVIELKRVGVGVIGWSMAGEQIINGKECEKSDPKIRPALWDTW